VLPWGKKNLKVAKPFEPHTQGRRHLLKASEGGGRFLRPRRDFVPAYLKTYEQGQLAERVVAAQDLLRSCKVCPRDCQVNRWENKTGVCKTARWARVSSAFLWRSAELTHLCSTKLTQWFKAGGGAFSFQVVEGVAV